MIDIIKKQFPQPKVSIITIVKNGEKHIDTTIKSIINQTYKNIEFVIIDGVSGDGTVEKIKEYESFISFWVSEQDKGIYDAMNKGIKHASGDYIWFLNCGDAIYQTDTLQNIFKENAYADVYYGETFLYKENSDHSKISKVPESLDSNEFKKGMVVSHQSMIVKRSIAGEYNLKYKLMSDQDWIIKILEKNPIVRNTNQILSKYLLGGISSQNFFSGWKERLQITYTHYGIGTFLFNIPLFFKAIIKRIIKKLLVR